MSDDHRQLLARAVELALANEARGGLPVGAVIALRGRIIAEGASEVPGPPYHPGRHAEMQALSRVAIELWPEAAQMVVVTTLEPCLMCFGACLLHGIGRVVFGAIDQRGGASFIRPHLPPYYQTSGDQNGDQTGGPIGGPAWHGPLDPGTCDPLYQRTDQAFAKLPCGRPQP
ncbi:tRNA-specific adenosine-34 deaminase [Enhygromyxa salina]|uniref:tRNA-specific adenosine-34 deaminase n=1 Tax=Enhygromyxa salina TaxID=215803 RepID=A0A0C2A6P0_9BACT|nr:nucleoside deaminase [Enhygromyxa salina]KIG19053.1 tRNA-specific adenosine-34 deaminase [Enhygromyxa salina]